MGERECGFCTVLACPPHPTQFSLSPSLFYPPISDFSASLPCSKATTHIAIFLPLVSVPIQFLCNCLFLLFLLLPLLSTCKWGRKNHTLNFLLLFDSLCPSFFPLSPHLFQAFFLPLIRCSSLAFWAPSKNEFLSPSIDFIGTKVYFFSNMLFAFLGTLKNPF